MSLRSSLIGITLLAFAPAALAQSNDNSINLAYTHLPTDDSGFLTVDGARTLREGEIYGSVSFNHAQNPLELGFPGDSRARSVVRQLTTLDLALGVGIFDGFSLGIVLPVVLDNDGRELLAPDFATNDTRSGGVGALRVKAEWTVLDTRERDTREEGEEAREEEWLDFALSVSPFMTFPTGRARDYLSDQDNVTGGGSVQVEVELFRRLRVGGSLGVEFVSSSIDIGDLEIEDRLRFGLAAEVLLLRPSRPRDQAPRLIPPSEDPAEQRRALRALAVLASLDGDTSPAEQAFLEDFAKTFEVPEDSRRALLSPGTRETLQTLARLEEPLEAARLEEAARDLVYLEGGADPRELAGYRDLADAQGFSATRPEAPKPGSGGWLARAAERVPAREAAPRAEDEEEASPHTLGLGVEVFGWTDSGQPFHDERERPIELGAFLRYGHEIGLGLRAGASFGLTNGIGAPDARYVLGMSWRF